MKKRSYKGEKCGICPSSGKKGVAALCLQADAESVDRTKKRTAYWRKREANTSLFRIHKLLVDPGTGLAGDTVATVSPPRFCKQKRRMDLK